MKKELDQHILVLANKLTIKGSFTRIGNFNRKDVAQVSIYVVCGHTGFFWARVLNVKVRDDNSISLLAEMNKVKDWIVKKGIDTLALSHMGGLVTEELNAFYKEYRLAEAS